MTAHAEHGHVVLVTSRRAWFVWGLALSAYVVAVFNRSSLGVSGVAAQHRFHASAAQLGVFGVLQLGVYAGLQVPVGVLLDRFGSRRLLVTGAALMALGQVLLSQAHTVPGAIVARVLVGAGDAMTFTSVLRLVGFWFAPRRVPLVTQVTGITGILGQLAASYPLVYLLGRAGWSDAFLSAAAAGGLVAVLVLLTVQDTPPGTAVVPLNLHLSDVRAQLAAAWREPGTRLGLWTHFVSQFSGNVFVLLWGYPFLVVGEGRSPTEAGLLLTLLALVGMVVGPVLGLLAGRWPLRRSWLVLTIVGCTAGVWTVVLAWPGRAPLPLLVLLAVVLGSNAPGSILGFDYARTENPPARLSSASGIVNVGGFVASLLTMLLIGLALSALAPHGAAALGDFRIALSTQYAVWLFGLAMLFRARREVREARGLELASFASTVRARRSRGSR